MAYSFFYPSWTILLSLLRPPSSVPHCSDHNWPPGVSTDGSKRWGSGVTPAVESACWCVSKVKFNAGKRSWQTLFLWHHNIGSLITNCHAMFFSKGPVVFVIITLTYLRGFCVIHILCSPRSYIRYIVWSQPYPPMLSQTTLMNVLKAVCSSEECTA